MTPEQYVQDKAASSGSSFYYAFLFLPKPRRAAITAFYAFCREVDDVVDDMQEPDVASAKLAWWHQQVIEAYQGQAQHPVMKALMPWADVYGIHAQHLQDIIAGCQMDLRQNRYLDFVGLQHYCHLVAGVVGEVSARIFGQTHEQTTAYAHELGLALQLTNIIRDVGEDARRGRIYLPLDDLRTHGVSVQSILNQQDGPAFKSLMQFQADRALGHYQKALDLLPQVDRHTQKPGLMMASIYRTLLAEIQSAQFPVLNQRVKLTPLRKFWLAWKVQALGML
ncbi:MAG: squalene synthase HpnD [Betaproteobacteria bacterium]|jgi:15-cis-phytoene synthase|nr:squalene synthase HpnD [Betaproteobacteria bacterium]NBP44041.1 squalene synthase HpnD [Betaproteobacteria bacterium]